MISNLVNYYALNFPSPSFPHGEVNSSALCDILQSKYYFLVDGDDFINAGPMMFTINASNDFVRVPISLMNDAFYELTETFIANLSFTSDVPPRTTISPNSATITIIDDESMFNKSTVRIQFIIYFFFFSS